LARTFVNLGLGREPKVKVVTIIVSQHVEGHERSNKKQVELVNLSFTILNNILEYLELLSISVPMTPH
jgi:hypothetical protein